MLVRNCAGGVVFLDDKVFLLKNDKREWVLPKGVIKNGDLPNEIAIKRVKEEAGISAEIILAAGHTNYEFYSVSRQKPVCNKITWFIMKALNEKNQFNEKENFIDGGYFHVDDAIKLVTYSQDKSLLNLSYKKYKEFMVTEDKAVRQAVG
jgi:8-oxo-dGTP pyrophosphatase MutT (NUDIX family)